MAIVYVATLLKNKTKFFVNLCVGDMSHPLVVHCLRAPYDVYIGRGHDPETKQPGEWGNPFSHMPGTSAQYRVNSRAEAILAYERYLRERLAAESQLKKKLHQLKGKTLGCWCAPKACHGEVLVKIITELFP